MNTAELKQAAKRFGADLIGIVSTADLAYLPLQENPLSIFPQATCAIVIGKRIPRGTIRGIEQGTEFANSFSQYGFLTMEDNFLSKTTYDITIWMEARGFEAVPLFAYDAPNGNACGVPVAPGKAAPNVLLNAKVLAQAAGLGEIGKNGLFLTPEFGPRQRFAMLLTDAELEPDKPFEPYLCKNCNACIDACPLEAFSKTDKAKVGFEKLASTIPVRNNTMCTRCKNGAIQTNEGRFNTVERIAAACGRACIAALEERGLTKEKFNLPFRQTAPWSKDIFGEKAN